MAQLPTGAQAVLSKITLPIKIAIGVGLSFLFAFGYWFVFYSDVASKIEGARRQKLSLARDLDDAKQAKLNYDSDSLALKAAEERGRDLNRLLPADTQEAAFLSSLQAASNVAGIDLKSFSPLDEQSQAFYAKVPMRLEFTGRFHQIAKFAYEVGKMDRIINVENIELLDPATSGEEIVLKGRCLATAFHAVKAKDAPAPAGQK